MVDDDLANSMQIARQGDVLAEGLGSGRCLVGHEADRAARKGDLIGFPAKSAPVEVMRYGSDKAVIHAVETQSFGLLPRAPGARPFVA